MQLRRHMQKHGDIQRRACYHECYELITNAMRGEIEDHRLEDTFQFDLSSSLVCNKVDVSTNVNHNNADVMRDVSEMQPSVH